MKQLIIMFFFKFVIISTSAIGQTADSTHNIKKDNKYNSYSSHDFLLSGGYNYCRTNFIDVGLRYYNLSNDGQAALAFSGAAAGCEFSVGNPNQVYIPYIGWQGQRFMIGYGIRAEYAIGRETQSFGFTPELGISLIEILRITGGYRFNLDRNDVLGISGFRFSVIIAFPLSFFVDI